MTSTSVSHEASFGTTFPNDLETAAADLFVGALESGSRSLIRRLALGGAGVTGAVTAGMVAIDMGLTHMAYYRGNAAVGVEPLGEQPGDDHALPRIIVAPGYDQQSAEDLIPKDKWVAALGQGNALSQLCYDPYPRRQNRDLAGQQLAEHIAKDGRPLHLLGLSMGSRFILSGLAAAVEQDVPVPHIDTLAMHSSPYSIGSVQPEQANFIRNIVEVAEILGRYRGGAVIKAYFRAANALDTRQIVDPKTQEITNDVGAFRAVWDGLKQFNKTASPPLDLSLACWFMSMEAQGDRDLDILTSAKVIDGDTRVTYIRVVDPVDDKTVQVNVAGPEWQSRLGSHVAGFTNLQVGGRHVAPEGIEAYAKHLAQAA